MLHEAKGKIKQKAGQVTSNPDLAAEGWRRRRAERHIATPPSRRMHHFEHHHQAVYQDSSDR